MKITALKAKLEGSLSVVDIGVAGKDTDLSAHVLFRLTDKGVEMLSFNQRICASAFLECDCEGDPGDAFTVEGGRLRKAIRAHGDGDITLDSQKGGEVQITCGRHKLQVVGLDPTRFPFWDSTLSEATPITTMAPERLSSALGYAKNFISDEDTVLPEISQTEMIDGSMWATDKKGVTLITLADQEDDESNSTLLLKGSSFRVHGKDIADLNKFFDLKDTEKVEILEHDKAVFFVREDGAMVGASRPGAQFPKLTLPPSGDNEIQWEVRTDDLSRGIKFLAAGAPWGNTQLKFGFKDGEVWLAMDSLSGKENTYPIEALEHQGTETLPKEGFWLDYPHVSNIMTHFGGEKTLKFGINRIKTGGYVRFRHSVGSDEYLTVVVWRI